MGLYFDETYGERVAGVYDEWYSDYDAEAINVLTELAGTGRALELGIGTGRFAVPLSKRNVTVHGVDVAPAMIAQLKSKPGADRVNVVQGNFADVPVEGEFDLVYIVFNTFFALLTQDEQVRCFRNVAAHLTPAGCFVIEAFVPDLTLFNHDQTNRATKVTTDRVEIDAGRLNAATQNVISQKIVITEGKVQLY